MRSSETNCSLAAEFSLVQEIISLQSERITQLYVVQSEQDPFLWFGVLFVDAGVYLGSVIRFNMLIDESYPNCPCPKIIFELPPYHPLIDPETGELDTKNAFLDWTSKTHKLHQLLIFVKRTICQVEMYIRKIQELFIRHQTCDTLDQTYPDNSNSDSIALNQTKPIISNQSHPNDHMVELDVTYDDSLTLLFNNFNHTLEVIKTFENSYDEFKRRVDHYKHECSQRLFDRPVNFGNDLNYLLFTPWIPEIHEPIRECVLSGRFKPTSLFASYHKETESVAFIPGSEPS